MRSRTIKPFQCFFTEAVMNQALSLQPTLKCAGSEEIAYVMTCLLCAPQIFNARKHRQTGRFHLNVSHIWKRLMVTTCT